MKSPHGTQTWCEPLLQFQKLNLGIQVSRVTQLPSQDLKAMAAVAMAAASHRPFFGLCFSQVNQFIGFGSAPRGMSHHLSDCLNLFLSGKLIQTLISNPTVAAGARLWTLVTLWAGSFQLLPLGQAKGSPGDWLLQRPHFALSWTGAAKSLMERLSLI